MLRRRRLVIGRAGLIARGPAFFGVISRIVPKKCGRLARFAGIRGTPGTPLARAGWIREQGKLVFSIR